jgi:glycosyltransferase involved in cell wall biosynthesis
MKKVSIILTTYNSEKSIQRTLDSIHNQKGLNSQFEIELIVVDDCSTDKTVDILKENDIDYLSTVKNSGGPNRGRNIGLEKASGNYICIMDHDDEWHPNKVASQLPLFDKAPIVTSGHTIIDLVNNKKCRRVNGTQSKKNYILYDKNVTFLSRLTKSNKGQHSYIGTIMYKSELKSIFFEEHFGMIDFDWLLRLFHNQSSVEVCDSLCNRYVYGNNLSLNETYRMRDFYYSLMTIEQYSLDFPNEVRISYKKIHGSRARYYYLVGEMKKARFYFLRSLINLKTIMYYFTTFFGANFVRRRFNIFG